MEVSGWHASEKMDGIRAFWDGKRFWTRSGNVIDAPAHITENLPTTPLDGEIWAGRGGFVTARNAVNHGQWDASVEFVAFDAPEADGDWLARVQSIPFHVKKVDAFTVRNTGDANFYAAKVIKEGGEGLVLRQPGIGYIKGRTTTFLKVKAH
jgi:DNA ligase-1